MPKVMHLVSYFTNKGPMIELGQFVLYM